MRFDPVKAEPLEPEVHHPSAGLDGKPVAPVVRVENVADLARVGTVVERSEPAGPDHMPFPSLHDAPVIEQARAVATVQILQVFLGEFRVRMRFPGQVLRHVLAAGVPKNVFLVRDKHPAQNQMLRIQFGDLGKDPVDGVLAHFLSVFRFSVLCRPRAVHNILPI